MLATFSHSLLPYHSVHNGSTAGAHYANFSPNLIISARLLDPNIPFSILNLNIHLYNCKKQIIKDCVLNVTPEPPHKVASNMGREWIQQC